MKAKARKSAFHFIVAGIFFSVGLLPAGKAAAQAQRQIDWCINKGSIVSRELQISSCTTLIQSGRWSAFYYRGVAHINKGQYDRAFMDLDQLVRHNPKDADALNGRCWVRAIMGRELQQALADCNESLSLRADDAATLDSRGFVCLKLGQFDHAIADYDAALELDPSQAPSHYGRGVAKLKKGDKDAGNADIAAAKAIQADVAEEFARYGIRLVAGVVSIAPATASKETNCARAVARRKSAGDTVSIASPDSHLARFANLNRK